MKRGKRDKRERKAGKSRVMSFSQREASLRNNLSARGEEVKKKGVMKGTENYQTQEKGKKPPHTGATMLTVRNGRWMFIIKSLYDITEWPHKHTADLPSSAHTLLNNYYIVTPHQT